MTRKISFDSASIRIIRNKIRWPLHILGRKVTPKNRFISENQKGLGLGITVTVTSTLHALLQYFLTKKKSSCVYILGNSTTPFVTKTIKRSRPFLEVEISGKKAFVNL